MSRGPRFNLVPPRPPPVAFETVEPTGERLPPCPPRTSPHEWGKLLDQWHDEVGPFHRLKPDGSPRCGVRYYTSSGPYPYEVDECHPRCQTCEKLPIEDDGL